MTEKKTRVASDATKKANLVRAYYAAVSDHEKAFAAEEKASARTEKALDAVEQAMIACEAAGFKILDA